MKVSVTVDVVGNEKQTGHYRSGFKISKVTNPCVYAQT